MKCNYVGGEGVSDIVITSISLTLSVTFISPPYSTKSLIQLIRPKVEANTIAVVPSTLQHYITSHHEGE